jgi:aspartate-semialdehyde dehydrogenase
MSRSFRVAVVGATGLVGETLINVLEERKFPVSELHALASNRSLGRSLEFRGRSVPVEELSGFDFSRADIGLFSAGGSVSAEFAPKAAQAGCVVIDNTAQFRYEDDIPLVVPEVNRHAIARYRDRNIIANPNCSTIQMLVALKPIHDAVRIERINVATYQSVSGAAERSADRSAEAHCQADRLQLCAADRSVPAERVYQRRDEDVLGDPQDPGGPLDPGERHDRAGTGVLWPLRGSAY